MHVSYHLKFSFQFFFVFNKLGQKQIIIPPKSNKELERSGPLLTELEKYHAFVRCWPRGRLPKSMHLQWDPSCVSHLVTLRIFWESCL